MKEKEIALKDGRTALLRSLTEADAAKYLDLLRTLARETPFLLWEPEELDGFTVADEESFIRGMNANAAVQMIVCEADGILAGEGRIIWDTRRRICHRAQIMFGIRKDFWGQGIAGAMMDMIERIAAEKGITRLELEVSAENQCAIGFYRHRGFQITGSIPQALHYAHRTADIHIMTKSL